MHETRSFKFVDRSIESRLSMADEMHFVNLNIAPYEAEADIAKCSAEIEIRQLKLNRLEAEIKAATLSAEIERTPKVCSTEIEDKANLTEVADLIRTCMNLPVKQLPKFRDETHNYHSFIRGFESSVKRHTNDPAELLYFQ